MSEITGGKTFIVGYTDEITDVFEGKKLPVIIFDDSTTASQIFYSRRNLLQ